MGSRVVNESTSWDALRQLRLGGKKPTLPLIVTTQRYLPRKLEGVGCMVIVHQAGSVMPIKLLEALDVIFMFDRCDLAASVCRMAQEKNVVFGSVNVWCKCASMLNTQPYTCESYASMVDWSERQHAT